MRSTTTSGNPAEGNWHELFTEVFTQVFSACDYIALNIQHRDAAHSR